LPYHLAAPDGARSSRAGEGGNLYRETIALTEELGWDALRSRYHLSLAAQRDQAADKMLRPLMATAMTSFRTGMFLTNPVGLRKSGTFT
jgi:hypothetical protein